MLLLLLLVVVVVVVVLAVVLVLSASATALRPISLRQVSLLRLLDSNFPGRSPTDMRIPPLKIKAMLQSNPAKSNASTGIGRIRNAARPLRLYYKIVGWRRP